MHSLSSTLLVSSVFITALSLSPPLLTLCLSILAGCLFILFTRFIYSYICCSLWWGKERRMQTFDFSRCFSSPRRVWAARAKVHGFRVLERKKMNESEQGRKKASKVNWHWFSQFSLSSQLTGTTVIPASHSQIQTEEWEMSPSYVNAYATQNVSRVEVFYRYFHSTAHFTSPLFCSFLFSQLSSWCAGETISLSLKLNGQEEKDCKN